MDNIKNYIVKYNFLKPKQCDDIVKNYSNNDLYEKHTWSSNGEKIETEKNKELDVTYLNNQDGLILFKIIESFLEDYQKKFKKSEKANKLINNLSSFRLNRYRSNTYMREHFDHIYSLFDGEKKGIPVLSILILLNDDFEGGQFKINNEDQNIKKGELIIFPSCFLFPHKVELITKGTRYSLVAWGF